MSKIIFFTYILLIFSVYSCGKKKSSTEPPLEIYKGETLETEMNGVYQALLAPINKSVSGHLNGSLTLVREEDSFVADVRLSGGPHSSLHTQSIHIGNRCPVESDDLNGDGFIDAEEGIKVYKETLIPLDDDLSSQWRGLGTYPITDEYGYYFWSRATSFEKLMSDLREEDINLTDDLIKINDNKALTFNSNVVVIFGVPEKEKLPDTIKSRGRMTKHQSLPIACGVIRKLLKTPGTVDNDTTGIPVPSGETIGGSSGADDGAIFRPSNTGGSGNYGEEDDEPTEETTNSSEYGPEDS